MSTFEMRSRSRATAMAMPPNFFIYPYVDVDSRPWPKENVLFSFSYVVESLRGSEARAAEPPVSASEKRTYVLVDVEN